MFEIGFSKSRVVSIAAGNQRGVNTRFLMQWCGKVFPKVFSSVGKGGENDHLANCFPITIGARVVDFVFLKIMDTEQFGIAGR